MGAKQPTMELLVVDFRNGEVGLYLTFYLDNGYLGPVMEMKLSRRKARSRARLLVKRLGLKRVRTGLYRRLERVP